jgi:hypothetical protein
VVAMMVLSIVMLSLVPLTMRTARNAVEANGVTHQTAALTAEISRLDAVNFDLLTAGSTCVTVSTPPFPHTRCTTINNISSKQKQLIVIVTPSGNSLLRPDTTIVQRTQPGKANPLNSP